MNQAYIQIKVKNGKNELDVNGVQEQNLLDILHQNNIIIPNPCHGNGTCGKCKIKVLKGYLPITEADRRNLSEDELGRGIRLACKANIGKKQEEQRTQHEQETKETCVEKMDETEQEELWIEIVGKSEENIIIQGIGKIKDKREREKEGKNKDIKAVKQCERREGIITAKQHERKEGIKADKQWEQKEEIRSRNCFIAIDIGTTTIVMALVDEETGEIIDTYTSLNHQRKYGADVISRIAAANDGKVEELKQLIEEDLWKGICRLIPTEVKIVYNTKSNNEERSKIGQKNAEKDSTIKDNCIENERINISKVIIVGNTTMIHLLMGYSCLSLGKYPFYSEHLEQTECKLDECLTFHFNNNISNKENVSGLDNEEKRMQKEYKKNPCNNFARNFSICRRRYYSRNFGLPGI